jgi:folate-binding protein YgfZ
MNSTAIDRDPNVSGADSGNARAEFEAVRSGCGLYDLDARARVQITGGDRTRWLNGMVTNNIRDLAAGHGVYAFLLNPQGRIQADLYAYNRGESLLVETGRELLEKVLGIFGRYIIMDDVEVTDVTGKYSGIEVAGPKARAVLKAAGVEMPELAQLQFADLKWQAAELTANRGDNPGVESFSLWMEREQSVSFLSLRQALIEAGAARVSGSALELFRIASGIPRYGQDIRERDLPQETEQQRALNFSKGCYVGQEIVERIRSRGAVHRKFAGFEIEGPLPAPGAKIQAEGKDVGEITSTAILPVGGKQRAVALGYIRREFEKPGKELLAGESKAIVAELPFPGILRSAS